MIERLLCLCACGVCVWCVCVVCVCVWCCVCVVCVCVCVVLCMRGVCVWCVCVCGVCVCGVCVCCEVSLIIQTNNKILLHLRYYYIIGTAEQDALSHYHTLLYSVWVLFASNNFVNHQTPNINKETTSTTSHCRHTSLNQISLTVVNQN